ncbi:Calcium uptake protein, mitochondrial [Glycine soja]
MITCFLEANAYRSKVFFNYEKRLQLHSPPEKVFEYFASCRTPEGELLMKPVDLMRAVVPVFPLFSLHQNPNLHIFFVTLLSIQESSFSAAFRMFDKDNDGEIDKEEFKKVMQSMRSHTRQGVQHRDGRRTGLRANASVENGGLMEYLFGKDGNGRLTHDKFVRFIRDLHDEIVRLEFAHYDYKSRKTIPAKDFAHSIVASADLSHLGSFAEVQGLLTRDDFQRAASHVCGLSLSDNVVEIVFHLFDANEDGNLSTEEFVSVLQHRERDIAQPVETGIMVAHCHHTSAGVQFNDICFRKIPVTTDFHRS